MGEWVVAIVLPLVVASGLHLVVAIDLPLVTASALRLSLAMLLRSPVSSVVQAFRIFAKC